MVSLRTMRDERELSVSTVAYSNMNTLPFLVPINVWMKSRHVI